MGMWVTALERGVWGASPEIFKSYMHERAFLASKLFQIWPLGMGISKPEIFFFNNWDHHHAIIIMVHVGLWCTVDHIWASSCYLK